MQNLFNKLFDKITISQEVWNTAMFLTMHNIHQEWYGMLVGRVEITPNGSNPLISNIKIIAEKILIPKQKVTSADVKIDQAATAELMTDEVLTSMRENKQRMIGWIHSHGSMSSYLSGTDMSNIDDELAMQPITLSLVVAYSQNTEYHPKEKEETPAETKVPETAKIFFLRSNKRKRVMKAFFKTGLLGKPAFKKLQKATKGHGDWIARFVTNLDLYDIKVVDDRANKNPKNKLDYFIGSKAVTTAKSEFHMSIFFSHRPPFTERKATSKDLAQYTAHQIIEWPEQMIRQKEELEKLLTKEEKEAITALLPRIQAADTFVSSYRHDQFEYPFGEYPVRYGEQSIKIASEYMAGIDASIKRNSRLGLYIPEFVRETFRRFSGRAPREITYIDDGSVHRTYNCIFCCSAVYFSITGACAYCDELEDTRSELVANYAAEFEIFPEEAEDEMDIYTNNDFIEEAQRIYNSGACNDCTARAEIECYCANCNVGFEIGMPSEQLEVEGHSCQACDSQLVYIYHLYNDQRDFIGFLSFCENCDIKYIFDYDAGQLMEYKDWKEKSEALNLIDVY